MATISPYAIEAIGTISGEPPFALEYPEAASQTYKQGAVLTLNASGHVTVAGTDEIRILGVAVHDGSGNSVAGAAKTKVFLSCDDTIFIANLSGTQVTAQSDVGKMYGITLTGSIWAVDNTKVGGATDKRRVVIMKLDSRNNPGDTAGREWFQFMRLYSIVQGTS